ncbi:MAG TPA: hypothetical protein VFF94_14755, partial [Novosphingobium sp.]|nr:hypothetical protein [Novosphingobium sp.]
KPHPRVGQPTFCIFMKITTKLLFLNRFNEAFTTPQMHPHRQSPESPPENFSKISVRYRICWQSPAAPPRMPDGRAAHIRKKGALPPPSSACQRQSGQISAC